MPTMSQACVLDWGYKIVNKKMSCPRGIYALRKRDAVYIKIR